jgi:hypothetical protein
MGGSRKTTQIGLSLVLTGTAEIGFDPGASALACPFLRASTNPAFDQILALGFTNQISGIFQVHAGKILLHESSNRASRGRILDEAQTGNVRQSQAHFGPLKGNSRAQFQAFFDSAIQLFVRTFRDVS